VREPLERDSEIAHIREALDAATHGEGRVVVIEGRAGIGKTRLVHECRELAKERGFGRLQAVGDALESAMAWGVVRQMVERSVSRYSGEIREKILAGPSGAALKALDDAALDPSEADHVARTIRPALEAGKWVLSDRFLDSSIAYQGGAGGLGTDTIRALHQVGSRGFLPDRTLLLQIPAEVAADRATRRDGNAGDRIGSRGAAYHAEVAAAFRAIAEEEPQRFSIVDAGGSADEGTARLMGKLADLLP